MRRLRHPLLLVAILATASLAITSGSPVRAEDAIGPQAPPPKKVMLWVVEGTPRIYLFGTIHIPDDRVKDLPAVVKEAYAASDVVWGELSVEDLDSPEIGTAMLLPDGKSLSDVVPKATAERVHAYLKSRGTSPTMFDRFKPAWAAVIVSILDALPLLSSRVPMDKQLLLDAKAAGKETGGLEEVKEQLAVFDSLSAEAAAKFLDEALKELEKAKTEGKTGFDALLDAYAAGDLDTILAEEAKKTEAEDPDLKAFGKRLLTDRNAVMVDRILERTKPSSEKSYAEKTYFVAVGAAHYPGPEGILALLEKKGKKVHRVAADEKIPAKAPTAAPTTK